MNLKVPRTLRIAVLECDTPLPETKKRFHGYGGVFEFLLRSGARALGRPDLDPDDSLQFSVWQVELNPDQYPDPATIDAILITGSNTPWINKLVDYTAKILSETTVRVIGVCFGHQIVGRALKAEVGRNPQGWEAAVNDVQLSEKGKEVFGVDKIRLHQMHRDCVFYYPEGVEALGSSPVCKVQGMYSPKRLLTVQGHPEFNQEIMTEIISTRHATGIFDDKAYQEHMNKVNLPHDGLVVSQAFLKFLLE
ncbi:putative glutamine amidotransferase-like protein [Fonsecaea pedrosoi]|nr:putative glutamine amidotransferase-like protein [Fonsecaea pedrosoi]